MRILAIDPGPTQSGVVVYGEGGVIYAKQRDNEIFVAELRAEKWGPEIWGEMVEIDLLAIEWIENYGYAVGRDVFQTVYWIGRFAEAWWATSSCLLIPRRDVKIALCGKSTYRDPVTGSMKGIQDKHIRRAIINRFPARGGGKTPAVGTKAKPGPLYGMKSHLWSALAVALTAEQMALCEPTANPRVEGADFDD